MSAAHQRHYTYVNPRKVASANPGFCFLSAGWRRCGITKWNKLLILERLAVKSYLESQKP